MRRVGYAQAVYGREEIDAVTEVLESAPDLLMGGPRVEEFESAVAGIFGYRHGVMVNSGSSANLCALGASRLPSGGEVITPALTFSTTVAPILQTGLRPVFVDVGPQTFVTSPALIEAAITERSVAILVPNLIGNVPDWPGINALARRHDLVVIEDSCDTVGATVDGRPTGEFADVSTTSFYASHVITAAGFGGMVMTNAPGIADNSRLLRGWGRTSSIRDESESIADRFDVSIGDLEYDAKFLFADVGYNFLPSAISAAFGLQQLKRLDEFRETRIRNFRFLLDAFAEFEDVVDLPVQRDDVDTAWLAFPLVVRPEAPFTRRDVQVALEKAGVQTRVVFTGNILRQPGFEHLAEGTDVGAFPNADSVMIGGILLGCHQGLDSDDLSYVVDTFRRFVHAGS